MIYSPEYESMDRGELEQLQLERMQATLRRVYRNVAAYRRSLDEANVDIDRIKTVGDLKYLPFTTREDLRESYPYDAFAVPLRDVIRIHSTSGTTAKPLVVGYTKRDLETWAMLVARVLAAAGVGNQDFVQVAFHYSLNTAGLGFHYGAEKLGASVIPASNEDVERQILIMRDYKSTALASTPGFALHVAAVLEERDIHPEELNLKVGLFGAEPWSEALRPQIEESLRLSAYDNYGLSEIIGPGVAFECPEKQGLHINEDHFIAEVVDPDTSEPVPPGERGELVFSTITKQGFPLIRYRTGDISSIIPGECSCGRTFTRMEKVSGRTDDMIIIEGVNVFPSQIEEILLEIEGIEPHYSIVLDRKEGLDTMELRVEVSKDFPVLDVAGRLLTFRRKVEEHMAQRLGFTPIVSLVEPKSIERSSGGKIKRVIDKREK